MGGSEWSSIDTLEDLGSLGIEPLGVGWVGPMPAAFGLRVLILSSPLSSDRALLDCVVGLGLGRSTPISVQVSEVDKSPFVRID